MFEPDHRAIQNLYGREWCSMAAFGELTYRITGLERDHMLRRDVGPISIRPGLDRRPTAARVAGRADHLLALTVRSLRREIGRIHEGGVVHVRAGRELAARRASTDSPRARSDTARAPCASRVMRSKTSMTGPTSTCRPFPRASRATDRRLPSVSPHLHRRRPAGSSVRASGSTRRRISTHPCRPDR